MSVSIRTVCCLALSFLLLQFEAANCDELEDAKERLHDVDNIELEITELTGGQFGTADHNLQFSPFKIQSLQRLAEVKRIVKRALRMMKSTIKVEREESLSSLCSAVQMFKQFLKSTTPQDELTAFAQSTEFQEMLNGRVADDSGNQLKSLSTNTGIDDVFRATQNLPQDLNKWKKYAFSKLQRAVEAYENEMKSITDDATKLLHAIYNAIVVWKDVEVKMKDDQKNPENLAEKESLIKTALALQGHLVCKEEA